MEKIKLDLASYWAQAVDYNQYKEIITRSSEEGKDSADKEIKKLADYTQLNLSRINRNDQKLVLEEGMKDQLKAITRKLYFLVISEGWCGDAAQSVPVVNKIVETIPNAEIKIFFRDNDETLINQYLTNGGKSIPIVIILNENFEEIAHWGPRPKPCAPFLKKYKENPETYTHDDFAIDIQNFYNQDKGHTITQEIIELL